MTRYAILDVNGPLVDEGNARKAMGRYFQGNYESFFDDDRSGTCDYVAGMLRKDTRERAKNRRYMSAVDSVLNDGSVKGGFKLSPYPAATQAMKKLRERDYRIVTFSDMPGAEKVDKALGWTGYVYECLGSRFGDKKDHHTFTQLQSKYGNDLVFFTDSGREAAAARYASVRTFQVDNGSEFLKEVDGLLAA